MIRLREFLGSTESYQITWRNIEEYGSYLVALGEYQVAGRFFEAMRKMTGKTDVIEAPLISEFQLLLDTGRVQEVLEILQTLTRENPRRWGCLQIQILAENDDLSSALDLALRLGQSHPDEFLFWDWVFKINLQNGNGLLARDLFMKHEHPAWQSVSYDYTRMVQTLKAVSRIADYGSAQKNQNDFVGLMNLLCQGDGLRHNFWFYDGASLMDTCPIKKNSPVERLDFNKIELESMLEILDEIEFESVIDIGGADGYFSYAFAKVGKTVTYVERDPLYFVRAREIFKFFKVDRRVEMRLLPMSAWSLSGQKPYDLCLALGLIYHISNCFKGLYDLARHSENLIIETSDQAEVDWSPRQAVMFEDGDPFSCTWLEKELGNIGYRVSESQSWSEYAREFNKSRTRRLFLAAS